MLLFRLQLVQQRARALTVTHDNHEPRGRQFYHRIVRHILCQLLHGFPCDIQLPGLQLQFNVGENEHGVKWLAAQGFIHQPLGHFLTILLFPQ